MTVQLSYGTDHDIAFEGMLADNGPTNIVSGLAQSRKLVSVAITADNDDVYTITINGVAFEYTADGSATTAEITVGLRNLINAGTEPVLASGTDTPLLIESTIDGDEGDFTYSDGVVGVGTLVETVLVAQGENIAFGKVVCLNELEGTGFGEEVDFFVRLPRVSADVTGESRLGFVLEDSTLPGELLGVYREQSMIPVLMSGRVWAKVEEAVAAGTQVYVRYAAGGNGKGSLGDSAGSSERAAYPRARYLKGAAANGLALVHFAD